jgi:hypothetical protein
MCAVSLDLTRTFRSALTRSMACLKAASGAADASPSMKIAPAKNNPYNIKK